MISIKKICKWYGEFHVLKQCSTEVSKGEVVVVCGPSGSGKSTLIKCVNGLEAFQKGEILVDGMSVSARGTNLSKLRSRVGMVFQHFELFPHLKVHPESHNRPVQGAGAWKPGGDRESAETSGDGGFVGARSKSFRRNYQVDNSSGWRLRARWRWIRLRCCSTNPLRHSIRR